MRPAYKATIEVVVRAETEGEACDGISELMRSVDERLDQNGWVIDWRYVNRKSPWSTVMVPEPEDYEEGDAFVGEDWNLLSEEQREDLTEWFNRQRVEPEDKAILARLYLDGKFVAWDCPECGDRVYKGDPDDWGNFQGVRQVDYTSYPGDTDKFSLEYIERMCDDCRMRGTANRR